MYFDKGLFDEIGVAVTLLGIHLERFYSNKLVKYVCYYNISIYY